MSETTDQRPGSSAEQKRARLAEILRKRDQSSGSNLSVVQERLWFLHAFDPVATTLTWVMRISGQLDQAALQQSLMDLVRRQESLRTTFTETGGRALRIVVADAHITLPVEDLSGSGSAEQEAALDRMAAQEAGRPFDLARAPLLRMTLIRLGDHEHALVATMHRIIADEASATIFATELAEGYRRIAAGGAPARADLPLQYPAVAAAERARLRTSGFAADLDHWRNRLSHLPVLEMPTDRPRPAVLTHAGGVVEEHLGSLDEFPAGVADVVAAGFAAVLAASTGSPEVVLGRQVDLRSDDTRRLIGPLTTHAVLRLDTSGDPNLRELIDRARRTAAEAEERTVPFERLVDHLKPTRDLSRTPLFQAELVVADGSDRGHDVADLHIHPPAIDRTVARHDLTLAVLPGPARVRAQLAYNRDLFDDETASRLLARLRHLLHEAAGRPEDPLSTLAALPPEEEAAVRGFESGPPLTVADTCLHDLIGEQAQRTPEAVAVQQDEDRLTYRELDEAANRLGQHLRDLGVGRGARVALFLDRSPRVLTALLGVLKSGAAYVPIDPSYPADRVRYMLEDAGVAAVVCERRRQASVPPGSATVVCLDEVDEASAGRPSDPLEPAAGPDDVAYLIYTSGSTGRPKGVMVAHRQAVASTAARWAYYESAPEAFLLLSPVSFDSSVAGIFWTLARGGRLVLPTAEEMAGPSAIADRVARGAITHLLCVPSLYDALLRAGADRLRSLRLAVVAGEACRPDLVSRHRSQLPDTELVNEYGPTETTVWATAYRCDHDLGDGPVPIGRPIPGVYVRLLDEGLRRVPLGVRGELYVGGAGVALGYHGRPALTAERFVPDPEADGDGQRLYATGDRARLRPDGVIEFLGRADDQVKLRGYRIELGEVETVLRRHPELADAAIAIREDMPGSPRLIAYVVGRDGIQPSRTSLVAFLQSRLPDHMVPATYVLLEELPRTAHGKVDRSALPAPEENRAELRDSYAAPRTPLEATVAKAFGEVLGRDRIGVNDSFFDLGGHSLLLAQLASNLRAAVDIDLPLRYFFEVPTPMGLARLIEVYQNEGLDAALASATEGDLAADAVLDPAIQPAEAKAPDEPRALLVTGATGYLGAFIAHELLQQSHADVYCLVRADDVAAGRRRLRETFETFRIPWPAENDRRVIPVIGDLALPLLGLDQARFTELGRTLDGIVHSGARVNFAYPYPALKPTNVQGTAEILRLACAERTKPVHYVSTADVFLGTGAPRPWVETDVPDDPANLPDGYIRSKWVAERLVAIARDRGLPVTIHRPALTMGHTVTGACHTTDFLAVALKGYLQIGMVPDYDEVIVAVPVDYVSRAIARLSLDPGQRGSIFHYANPQPAHVRDIYAWLRSYGYKIRVVPYTELRENVLTVDPDHPLYPVMPLYPPEERLRRELFEVTAFEQIDCAHAVAALRDSGIECTGVTEALAHSVLGYLVDTGWIDPPDKQAAQVGEAD